MFYGEDIKLIWNNNIIEIKEPSITKLTFDGGKLIDNKQMWFCHLIVTKYRRRGGDVYG